MPLKTTSLLPLKRTRRNVVQSKNGCLTCRARRKKCDETLPFCRSCQASGRLCDGYSTQALRRLNINHHGEAQEHRLVKVCFEVLRHGQYGEHAHGSPWLQFLVPVAHTSNVVRAAMALFGAVYSASTAAVSDQSVSISLRRRHIALFGIRQELTKGLHDFLPLFLACSVVAASEALIGDLASAILHAQAACRLVRLYGSQRTAASESKPAKVSLKAPSQLTEILYTLAVSMDMHSASYRLSHPPDLPAIYPTFGDHASLINPTTSELATLCIIHSCHHYTARAHHFKYDPAAASLQQLLTEQSQHLAALRSRLEILRDAKLDDVQGRKLMLRAQCLSTLIYVSAILNPYETFYDKHERDFIEIVQTCDQLLARAPSTSTASRPAYQFDPGIFQPCYLTTMKCRKPAVRRRARSILSTLGSEGPWNGRLLASVAGQAIDLEEKFGHPVLEENRIHGCTTFTSENGVAPCSKTFEAEFSLCRDLEGMLKGRDADNPRSWKFIKNEVFLD